MKLLAALLLSMITAAKAQQLKTIDDRLAEFGDAVRTRFAPRFETAGVPYPPARVTFIAIKQNRVLQVYAAGADGAFRFICSYPVVAASGELGPKLKEGDRQVPEGIYRVRELNPNSLYHLSLWLNYPNEFDLARAAEDGRTEPGSEIMIHGGDGSRGCLAMGDEVAEDLFVLAAITGIENVTVVITPVDFRARDFAAPEGTPPWTGDLYERIARELRLYPAAPAADQVSSR
jgi:murein L,D-transpeptidase YafK